jgi:large subunit ribosomal protein L6
MSSRVAKNPVNIPAAVNVQIEGKAITVKGAKGALKHIVHDAVHIKHADNQLLFSPVNEKIKAHNALAGTTRALIHNNVVGVSEGFVRELELKGIGYRASVKGNNLELNLGFSHPVVYPIPQGVTIECPEQASIVIKGSCKQQLGQVAAEIRHYRRPDAYKGKGVRYKGERIVLKETKKK